MDPMDTGIVNVCLFFLGGGVGSNLMQMLLLVLRNFPFNGALISLECTENTFGIFFEFSIFFFVSVYPPYSKFAPKNGWLEYDCFVFGWLVFRGELLVLGRVDPKVFSFPSVQKWIGVSFL